MRRATAAVSVALGLGWNALAVTLLGGPLRGAPRPAPLAAGVAAGLAVGAFTIWTRARRDGRESLRDGVAGYYLGILAYGIVHAVVERVLLVARHGGWTDFNLRDHLALIGVMASLGTFPYGPALIPLSFLSRALVWRVESRR